MQKQQADLDRRKAALQLEAEQRYRWAASKIQRAWRCYSHRKTFEFYRDLIKFKQQCDPRQVLRHINPAEANLIDAAAGARHVEAVALCTWSGTLHHVLLSKSPSTQWSLVAEQVSHLRWRCYAMACIRLLH